MHAQGSTHLFHHPNHPTTATTPTIQQPPPPPPPSEAEAAYSKGNCHRSKIISARAVVVDAVTFAVDDGDVVVIVLLLLRLGQ